MTYNHRLSTARGLLAAVLDGDLSSTEAALDVCDALNELDLPGELPTYPERPAPSGGPVEQLRQARAELCRAIPTLPNPQACLHVTRSVRWVDAALARLGGTS